MTNKCLKSHPQNTLKISTSPQKTLKLHYLKKFKSLLTLLYSNGIKLAGKKSVLLRFKEMVGFKRKKLFLVFFFSSGLT